MGHGHNPTGILAGLPGEVAAMSVSGGLNGDY